MNEQHSATYYLGLDAGEAGELQGANPYPPGSEEREEWGKGWFLGRWTNCLPIIRGTVPSKNTKTTLIPIRKTQ